MSKRDPLRYPVMCYVPIETLEKIKTVIEGKKVRIKSPSNCRATDNKRQMGLADFMIQIATEAVADVVPSRAARAWGKEKMAANRAAMKSEEGDDRKAAYRKRHLTFQMRIYYDTRIQRETAEIAKLEAVKPQTERTRDDIRKHREKLDRFRKGYERYDAECRKFSDGRKSRKA